MKRCAGLVVALVLVLFPACKPRICEPWKPLGLPGVTSIEACYDTHIAGETTATTDDFVRAVEAKGFTAGRQTDGTYGNQQSWVTFTKSDDPSFYRLPSDVGARSGGKSDNFFIDKSPKFTGWISEAEWKRLPTIDADRAALVTKLAAAAQLFADTKSAKERCDDAVLGQDPALNTAVLGNKTESYLLDTDLYGLTGWPAESRSYTTGAAPKPREKPSDISLESRMVPDLVFDRTALDDLSKIRMLHILRVTSYEAPRVSDKSTGLPGFGFFTGGHASFEVGVVDLIDHKVLCRTKAEAQSAEEIEVTRTADGNLIGDPGRQDLGRNIDRVARAALGKMSPLLK